MTLEIPFYGHNLLSFHLSPFQIQVTVMVNHLDESLHLTLGLSLGTRLATLILGPFLVPTHIVASQRLLQHLYQREVARQIHCLLATVKLVYSRIETNERLACSRNARNKADGLPVVCPAMVYYLAKFNRRLVNISAMLCDVLNRILFI